MTAHRPFGRALIGAAFLAFGCGAHGKPAIVHHAPHAAPPAPHASLLARAQEAEREGRATEALGLFESLIAGTQVPATIRSEALARGAALVLADPGRRDLAKVEWQLAEVARMQPRHATLISSAAMVGLLQQFQALQTRAAAAERAIATSRQEAAQQSVRQQDRSATLRQENRQLREEVKTLQAELSRKDDALRRTAEKLLKTPPG